MSIIQRYTLGKSERMKSRKAIDQLFDKGKAFSLFPFRVIYIIEQVQENAITTYLKCGFSASSKRFKKATDRNRIKRQFREAWRLQKNELQQISAEQKIGLNVFLIYVGNEMPEYADIFTKTGATLKRLIKIVNENTKAGI